VTRNILTAPVQRIEGSASSQVQELLAVEEPLEIRLGERAVSITMRTPGHDLELAAGFLFTEGIVQGPEQIERIRYAEPSGNQRQAGNTVVVELRSGVDLDLLSRLDRHFYMTSSCGVCGKASIDALQTDHCPSLPHSVPLVDAGTIHSLPARLRAAQPVFEHTGGLHAAGLFDIRGTLLSLREDVGRHNAVDKLIGSELLDGRTALNDRLILVSGRASFELMQKALMAGIPILAAVGAPSSLAVEVAQRFNMTLLGFVRENRFNIYSGAQRIR
jgi:FdhD protein